MRFKTPQAPHGDRTEEERRYLAFIGTDVQPFRTIAPLIRLDSVERPQDAHKSSPGTPYRDYRVEDTVEDTPNRACKTPHQEAWAARATDGPLRQRSVTATISPRPSEEASPRWATRSQKHCSNGPSHSTELLTWPTQQKQTARRSGILYAVCRRLMTDYRRPWSRPGRAKIGRFMDTRWREGEDYRPRRRGMRHWRNSRSADVDEPRTPRVMVLVATLCKL